MTDDAIIAPLTKVTLIISTETAHAPPSPAGMSVEFTFVFGIGIEGLTEFEMALLGKAPGERMTLPIGKVHPSAQFEHLLAPLKKVLPIQPPLNLQIKVNSVSPVTDRELVHALSQKTETSECNCGGGCGG